MKQGGVLKNTWILLRTLRDCQKSVGRWVDSQHDIESLINGAKIGFEAWRLDKHPNCEHGELEPVAACFQCQHVDFMTFPADSRGATIQEVVRICILECMKACK